MKGTCVASKNRPWREARCGQYLLYWQAERQRACGGRSRFRAVLARMRPRSGTLARQICGPMHACTVASSQAGRVEGRKRGPFGDLTPEMRMGSVLERRALDRLHGRIPQAGPCSSLRRSLLHASARGRFWPQPLVGWRGFGSSPGFLLMCVSGRRRAPAVLGRCAKTVTAQCVFDRVSGS